MKLCKEFKESVKAYNNKQEPSYNQNYNDLHKLGTMRGRGVCNWIASDTWGVMRHGKKITPKVIENFYESTYGTTRQDVQWIMEGDVNGI